MVVDMLKKRIRAALMLIATEDLKALRVLVKGIIGQTYKSVSSYKKS
jgi:hypothetical protein